MLAGRSLAVLTLMFALLAGAWASNHVLYECVDANGSKQFTNIPANPRACRALSIAPINTAPQAPSASGAAKAQPRPPQIATPSNFPRVDRDLQRQRDNDRARILQNELGGEERLLAQAKKDLAEQEGVRLGHEKNYQRVLERLEPFQKRVKLHEDNVANLRNEISKMR